MPACSLRRALLLPLTVLAALAVAPAVAAAAAVPVPPPLSETPARGGSGGGDDELALLQVLHVVQGAQRQEADGVAKAAVRHAVYHGLRNDTGPAVVSSGTPGSLLTVSLLLHGMAAKKAEAARKAQGTTIDPDLWPQFGEDNSKCYRESNNDRIRRVDRMACQTEAVARGHTYYSYISPNGPCVTAATCASPITGTKWAWKMYHAEGTATLGAASTTPTATRTTTTTTTAEAATKTTAEAATTTPAEASSTTTGAASATAPAECVCTYDPDFRCQMESSLGPCWSYGRSSCETRGGYYCDYYELGPLSDADFQSEMQKLLALHNAHRADHHAPALTWSDTLSQQGQAWAERCKIKHSTLGHGENIYVTSGRFDGAQATTAWYQEILQYDFGSPGFSSATGHFTQVVWKGTTEIGCGVAYCSNMKNFGAGYLAVCEYSPPGNYANTYAANVLPA